MKITMRVLRRSSGIILILYCTGVTLAAGENIQLKSNTVKGKDSLYSSSFPPTVLLDAQSADSKDLQECFRRNQMGSVGFEIIQEQCKQECELEKVLVLMKSPQKDDYTRGVKALCEINDPQAVQPLIIALKRELNERSGLWAWIIPALGRLRDSTAVPVLIHTLTLNDDDWLGREMSVSSLGFIGDPSSVPHLLVAAWRSDTRDAAIEALINFRDKRAIPVFLSALDPEEVKQTREAASNGLSLLGAVAIPHMIEAFNDFSIEQALVPFNSIDNPF